MLGLSLSGLDVADDVDLQAGQLCGETRVLPLFSDGKGELALRHDGGRSLFLLFDLHLHHERRAERVLDEPRRVAAPLDHVDLLAVQFVHDVLNANPAQADARTDGVDTLLPGKDCHLAAGTGLAGDADDLDRPVVYLRHFHLEESPDERLVRPGHDDLRSPDRLVDGLEKDLIALSHAVSVVWRLFRHGKHGFRASQFDGNVSARLDALHRDGVHLADFVGVLLEDDVTLGFSKALNHHLLGSLGCDASRAVGQCPGRHVVAQVGDRADLLRVGQRYLGEGILHLLDDRLHDGDVHVPRVRVELDGDILSRRDAVPPVRRRERGFDGRKNDVLRKIPLGGKLRKGDDKVALHIYHPAHGILKSPTNKESGASPLSQPDG